MDRCTQLLAEGVFNVDLMAQNEDLKAAWEDYLASKSAHEAATSLKSGMTFPIEGAPVTGHFDPDQSTKSEDNKQSHSKGETFGHRQVLVLKKYASPQLLERYAECIRDTSPGIHCWADAIGESQIIFRVTYFPSGKTAPITTTVTSSTAVNARAVDENVPRGQIFRNGAELISGHTSVSLIRDDPKVECSFTVNTDQGSDDVQLPAVHPPAPPLQEITLTTAQITNRLDVEVGVLQSCLPDGMHNAPPYNINKPNMAEWEFVIPAAGTYRILITYASAESRPMQLSVNGVVLKDNAVNAVTGSFEVSQAKELSDGFIDLEEGRNKIRLSADHYCPHVCKIRLELT
jgi:hypothetical protein